MNPTDAIVDEAIAGLENEVQPGKGTGDSPEEKPKPEAPAEVVGGDDKKVDEPEGYTADEFEDEEEPGTTPEPETPKAQPEIDTSGLSPEAKFIVDGLPYITARIKDGEGFKEVQIKSWTQLPEDVEFASKRDEIAFNNAINAQEHQARQLQQDFRQKEQTDNVRKFQELEDLATQKDISKLQRAGDLPRFKAKPADPDFDKDPATKQIQEIMDFMNKRNEEYTKAYNDGGPYRRLGFEEAYHVYARTHEVTTDAETREDEERRRVNPKVNVGRGLSNAEFKKSVIPSGTTTRDILAMIDAEEF